MKNITVGLLVLILLLLPSLSPAQICGVQPICDLPPSQSEIISPGGDHPDERFSVDSGNPPTEPFFLSDPAVTVLRNGYKDNLLNFMNYSMMGGVESDPDGVGTIAAGGVLVIPSGGLNGLENSVFFKESLAEYVRNGGVLLVLG